VAADGGDAAVLHGAGVEGAEFADHVAVADFQPRRLPLVFLVLRCLAERDEMEDLVVRADLGVGR
jgi:hypothetical protein